jgi:hypothetical protein
LNIPSGLRIHPTNKLVGILAKGIYLRRSPMKVRNIILMAYVGLFLLTACGSEAGEGEGLVKETTGVSGVEGLVEAFEALGAKVLESDPVEQPFFSVVGKGVLTNGQGLQVFEYADADTAAAEAETIAPDGSSVGTTMMMWVDDPNFFSQDNLIVLYLGSDPATLGVLETVMGPQIAGR